MKKEPQHPRDDIDRRPHLSRVQLELPLSLLFPLPPPPSPWKAAPLLLPTRELRCPEIAASVCVCVSTRFPLTPIAFRGRVKATKRVSGPPRDSWFRGVCSLFPNRGTLKSWLL
uniref:Transcription-repair-coupling factor n=1 Tax=Anthurium amnicola TaxID=1678845 RepID=A0A1D1YZN2_9ARAE